MKVAPDWQPQGLFRNPVQGGQETRILPALRSFASFAVASRGIYFAPDAKTLQFLDLATGKVSTLTVLETPLWDGSLSVSLDEGYLVRAQPGRRMADLRLVENFR